MNDNFKFFVPIEIEKAKDKAGVDVMKISGIASTTDRDSDGEVLDPAGFDLSYFLSNGFINWHHQSKDKPEAIIGEPTKAEIRPEGMYVEGILYPESKLAKQVYELAKGLEKSSGTRRLGFSIEGKVIERDKLDERYVKKAKITGLAVTPTPKNASTLVDIMKGNFNELDSEDAELTPENVANGGATFIIDIVKPNGDRVTVDKNYNIKVLSKGTDTTNAGKLSPADVDGKLKDLQSGSKNEEKVEGNSKKLPKFATLNKSIIFNELLKATENFETSKQIIKSINFNNMSKTVTLEEIQKALSDIGVDVDTTVLKGAQDEMADDDKKKSPIPGSEPDTDDDKEKPSAKKDEDEDDDNEDMEKAIKDAEDKLEIMKAKKAEKEAASKNKKSEGSETTQQEIEEEVNKKMGSVEKGLKDELSKAQTSFTEGFGEIKELFKSFTESMNERLSNVENQSTGRKSAPSAKFIEKAFGDGTEKHNEGKVQLSLSKHKQQISDVLLTKSGIEKGQNNEFYVNAMMTLEATGGLSKSVITDLYTNSNILITE